MNTQTKTVIIIIIIFILVLGGLFFAYQLFIAGDGVGDRIISTEDGERGTLFPDFGLFDDEEGGDAVDRDSIIPVLRQISSTPTAGGTVFTTEEGTVIRYVERATGHIFETTTHSLEQNRISNTTIPRIQESIWSPDGEMVILQYLDGNEILKSFYGKVSKEASKLDGWFLGNNITAIDVHEDGDIFYIQRIGKDAKGIVSNFDGTDGNLVFSSKVYDWIPLWIGDSVGVVTKASRDIAGFLYQLHSEVRTKLISNDGLIVNINPDGTKVLFSMSNSRKTNLFIHNINTEETTKIPFITLAEKCTWADNIILFCASPHNKVEGVVPDDWYKGILSFSDDIWVFNAETGVSILLYDAAADGRALDMTNLIIDSEQKILLFTNKNDLILWGLSLD
jgi:hypothetical protein